MPLFTSGGLGLGLGLGLVSSGLGLCYFGLGLGLKNLILFTSLKMTKFLLYFLRNLSQFNILHFEC